MDVDEVARCILEFYNTQDEDRRKHNSLALNALQENREWWRTAIILIQQNYSPVVQFYGAKSLYDLLNRKFDVVSENSDITNEVRQFYVQKLTSGAQTLPHSLLNILTSGLAVFLMKCLPDIWPAPFFDLMNLWATQQELLLRVLAEVGAEFPRISMPLKQRNLLRTELLRISNDIAQMANAVLTDPNSPPSLKNAAVECVELWLKLPGAKITDFLVVFKAIFENISTDIQIDCLDAISILTRTNLNEFRRHKFQAEIKDLAKITKKVFLKSVALSRILSTLKGNEELPNLPDLIQQFTQFIAISAVPLILNEINLALVKGEDSNFEENLSDIIPLICSVTEFIYTFIRQIVIKTAEAIGSPALQETVNVYFTLCGFFAQMSTIKGIYPARECISDLPESFWCALREELTLVEDGKPYGANKTVLGRESVKFFLEILQSAIEKISYFPEVSSVCDKAEFERFESYRITRGDVSINAIQIAPAETLNLLAGLLDNFLVARDIFRSESTLYYLKEAADYLKEEHTNPLIPYLSKCRLAKLWPHVSPSDLTRFGVTLMELLHKIEHLLITSSRANETLPEIIRMVLEFMHVDGVNAAAIDTLIAFVKNRDSVLQPLLEPVIQECYNFFSNDSYSDELRLSAIRCMGIALSMKDNAFILNSLDQFLLPRLMSLKELISADCGLSESEKEKRILFELSVLAQLVATLEIKNTQGDLLDEKNGDKSIVEEQQSPVRLIIDQCTSFFEIVFANRAALSSKDLVGKVCEVMRAGLLSLHTSAEPLIETYLKYLDAFMFSFPGPACELAKTLFLTFRTASGELAVLLFARLAQWFSNYCNQIKSGGEKLKFDEKDEKFLELANHVLKKNWLALESVAKNDENGPYVQCILQSVCFCATNIIQQSRDITMMQESFRVLILIIKNCSTSDIPLLQNIVESVGTPVVSSAFLGIQSELCGVHLTQIADILFHFTKAHPDLSRKIVADLRGGDSQLAQAMFSQSLSIKNFRARVNQMHQALLKDLA